MDEKSVFLQNLIVNEMGLNNLLNDLWRGTVIPDSIRVDQENRTLLTDAQAISFRAKDREWVIACRNVEFEFLESFFEIVPRD